MVSLMPTADRGWKLQTRLTLKEFSKSALTEADKHSCECRAAQCHSQWHNCQSPDTWHNTAVLHSSVEFTNW
jgi:hypothetical protein